MLVWCILLIIFLFKQKTAYEMRISDWSSDVCSSDLQPVRVAADQVAEERAVAGADDMHGIDDARHRRAVAVDRGDDIVQLVRGRVEALERPAAVRPQIGRAHV